MQIFNLTGKSITVNGEFKGFFKTFASEGHAYCEVNDKLKIVVDMIAVYRKDYGFVRGLPSPDRNFEKLYIVTKDVAKAAGPRLDLLVPEGPEQYNGTTYYKLVNV